MKKLLLLTIVTILSTANVAAQEDSKWTLNTRAWTTNYFTSSLESVAKELLMSFAFDDDDSEGKKWVDRIIPSTDLVFPVGLQKKGFDGVVMPNIYGPYHHAFSNPFKHIGDYAIGFDASYKPAAIGCYAGAFFKSQEIVFKEIDQNLRGFYFQPRAGIVFGSEKNRVEIGAFYDVVTGSGGSFADTNKKRLKGGFGFDIAATLFKDKDNHLMTLQFSMPLHNFLDEDYVGQKGVKRRVGYIMMTERICF